MKLMVPDIMAKWNRLLGVEEGMISKCNGFSMGQVFKYGLMVQNMMGYGVMVKYKGTESSYMGMEML